MGVINVEAGDMVVLKDDRCRRLLVGAAMMCECMLSSTGESRTGVCLRNGSRGKVLLSSFAAHQIGKVSMGRGLSLTLYLE